MATSFLLIITLIVATLALNPEIALSNPIILHDESLALIPSYTWKAAIVILFLEALGVSLYLKLRKFKFLTVLAVLFPFNLFLFALFSKWLILISRYEPDIPREAYVAEGLITFIEAALIFFLSRKKLFTTQPNKSLSFTHALFISLIANIFSAILGLITSFAVYQYLYKAQFPD